LALERLSAVVDPGCEGPKRAGEGNGTVTTLAIILNRVWGEFVRQAGNVMF